jgi:hypothetical protein
MAALTKAERCECALPLSRAAPAVTPAASLSRPPARPGWERVRLRQGAGVAVASFHGQQL